ncbi:HprK-related kinase A [Methylotuvimicrobium buryatense]|uniref:HprK-related kinase A n=1 Tax=Methylotuvimicrobium buryatense TaxID=95641 RepID=UPI00034BAD69|nr:HprK-related kinase A [Methylotuvimicrobium buryatense]
MLSSRVKSEAILLEIKPFKVCIETSLPAVIDTIKALYSDYNYFIYDDSVFVDFYIKIEKGGFFRGYSQAQCYIDGKTPFKPLPLSQAYPFFEWGLNWIVASHIHYYLLLHAAVVEKNGHALILCGKPGAGKSTLCAAMVGNGWRLFSDEMAIIDLKTNELVPFVRPVSLKNRSIDLIQEFVPEAVFGPCFHDTAKGIIAHMKPNSASVFLANKKAFSKWIVFPQYQEHSQTLLQSFPKGKTVLELIKNSFNYNMLGGYGFSNLCQLVDRSDCYNFIYSNLDEAVVLFDQLLE